MNFADKLIKLRRKNGMSQEDLAEKLDVSRQAISKWEGLLSVPDLQNVLKISELFNVSTDYLLKDEVTDEGCFVPVSDGSSASVSQAALNGGETCATDQVRVAENGEADASQQTVQEGMSAFGSEANCPARSCGVKDKGFAVAASVLLLAITVLSAFSSTPIKQMSIFVILKFLSLTFYVAAGVLVAMSLLNKKFMPAAFGVLLANSAVSIVNTVLNSIGNVLLLYYAAIGLLALVFCLLAVLGSYSGGNIRINRYLYISLPIVCAVMSAVVSLVLVFVDDESSGTLEFGMNYIAYFLLGAILFRESGYARGNSENTGLAGITSLVLAAAVSAIYIVFSLSGRDSDLADLLYRSSYGALYIGGLLLTPWLAFYSPKINKGKNNGAYPIVVHIFLTCLTCFVWHWIWMAKVTSRLNGKRGVKKVFTVLETVLYIILPFFYIYWYYRHGHQIFAEEKKLGYGTRAMNAGTVLFAAFSPLIGSVIMQSRINSLLSASAGEAQSPKEA